MDTVQATRADDAPIRSAHKYSDFALLTVVALVVAALLVGAVVVRRGTTSPLRTVRMAGDSAYFDDPAVKSLLESKGFRVSQNHMGTAGIAKLPDLTTNYDVAFAGSDTTADRIIVRLRDQEHITAGAISPFSSPMVVLTYEPIRRLLENEKIVRTSDNGTKVFNVGAYLDFAARQTTWSGIPGNTVYPSTNRALISTTDAENSNSAGMLIAIETYVKNNNTVVNDFEKFRNTPEAALIRSTFRDIGSTLWHTPDLLALFIRDGMSRFPMAMFYENDYIGSKLENGSRLDNVELLYPNPTVMADNTLVWWNETGRDFVNLLNSDHTLIELAEKNGFRAHSAPGKFVQDMRGKGVPVSDLDHKDTGVTVAPLPTEEILSQMIVGLTK